MSETVKNNETQNKPGKGKRILKAIINTIINILIVIVLITSILIAVMSLTSKSSGISTIFGYTIQPIQSDSMKGGSPEGYPEGDFGHGDLMIAKATEFKDTAEYNIGDIVTFKTKDTDNQDMLIVHRIVDAVKKDDGTYVYQTQGDNRQTSPVPDQQDVSEYIRAWDIGSVYYTKGYTGKILKGWGAPLDYIRTQQGFFLVVLLPMIIFFMYALVRVVISATGYKKSKAEEEKKAAVDEAVAEALAAKDNGAPVGVTADMTAEDMEQFRQFQEFRKMQKAQQDAEGAKVESQADETPAESVPTEE